MLCGFHFQPLPYCAFVETKGRARGGPPCHLGVYLSKLCHARYTYIACSIRLLAPLDFSHDWSFVNIVDLFFFQDYHVIFLYSWDCKTCLVYDLDSELPFPTFFHKYVTETFRTDQVLKSDFHR